MDKEEKSQQKIRDDMLWAYAVQDVTPLESSDNKDAKSAKKRTSDANITTPLPSMPPVLSQERNEIQGREIDNATRRRFDRGQISIDAILDMHGMSQVRAYDALMDFILRSRRARRRCVLVITGKGGKRGDDSDHGVLKIKTPQWLADDAVRPYILRFRVAKPKDGGAGALYVLLRRK